MNKSEYEQKKHECWEELWNDLIKDKAPVDFPTAGDIFEYVFSKAYALGKQAKDAEDAFAFDNPTNTKSDGFDTILNDIFSKGRRLSIAAMVMQGILSNADRMKQYGEIAMRESETLTQLVARNALRYADALIAQSELTKKLFHQSDSESRD